MGFFEWIRAGVRRAVLLGVSDAVTEIGTRSEHEDFGPALATALQSGLHIESDSNKLLPAAAGGPARKRLGKSLEEIRTAGAKS